MRIEGRYIDLRTVAVRLGGVALVGGRRRIEVRESVACISILDSPDNLRVGMATEPELDYAIRCTPRGLGQMPFDANGWLKLDDLTPHHRYWLELRPFGAVSIEREDGDPAHCWYWSLPADLWGEMARCT